LYVADAAEGLVTAAERYDDPDPVNLGTEEELSMRALAETLSRACEFDGEILWDPTKPNGQPRRKLDVSRARERFGFTAKTSFRDGLAKTIAWYRANRDAIAARESERKAVAR
jgi:GDP-L-fucose synthase